ncbi:MAG: Phosphotransferase enzyme family protein [Pelotomaculum sp. PtaB.Bin013]|uniref:non-specific serine/threonine protein kinase n=1 Tax=Pelotomaculum isophthalicicum JI TaxID=947010 RepID=A0A9X4H2P6_9FIRM|nr:RIO1 family regulatory kinase/ATPase [Pelotomaculum isophthalicicum]MDF9409030.1 phosphotransferase [Pelotomaculum isophthalicicum JI]OPX91351.1 MAG: Phosphotransferase enzyme family protein [Pelotomaculum sp. PtaB.Bin013]
MDSINKLELALGVKVSYTEKKHSLRNNVFFVKTIAGGNLKQCYVIKEYANSSAGNEVFIIDALHKQGINVPEVIWYDDKCIIMQYIPGVLLTDLLIDHKLEQEIWINALATWLRKLHGFMNISNQVCLCMSDLNLRNFIFNGREFYGIDFESVCFYPPERDLGGICAFILNNDPMFEYWKYGICNSLIKAYETVPGIKSFDRLDHEAIRCYLIEELKAAAERRESQRHYLNEKIKEFSCTPLMGSIL